MKLTSAILGNLKGRARTLRREADHARDRGDWGRAAGTYERYLAECPQDAPIWIQLGHARKESGDLPAAEAAYRQALALAPADADAHLQLGHLLKLSGRAAESAECYRRALELDGSSPARHELEHLERQGRTTRGPDGPSPSARARTSSAEARRLRDLGDLARDARTWPAAVGYYRSYLELDPEDAAIWVQYGHACKESGDLQGAERAYRKASLAAPDDVDPLLHLARLLASKGSAGEARTLLQRAFSIEPRYECYESMIALDALPVQHHRGDEVRDALLLDVADLLDFLEDHGKVTGIQRVQIGLAAAIAAVPELGPFTDHGFVFASRTNGMVWRLRWSELQRVLQYCTDDDPDAGRARELVARARAGSIAVRPAGGCAYLILGAFWGRVNAPAFYRSLHEAGARIGVLIHDIFPVTHAELTGGGLGQRFDEQLRRGTEFWDFILANSAYTASEVERYLSAHGMRRVPVRAVPLAHRMRVAGGPAPVASRRPGTAREQLRGRPFVLCVGTIEPRKNHQALFQVWRMLKQSGIDPPTLVLVGRVGWRVADLVEQMQLSGMLGKEILLLENLSDGELSALYESCLFTVLPSFAEGWGLPIGESLDHGKVCITSQTSSMPEVGGDFAIYVDPFNTRSLYDAVHSLLSSPGLRREREGRIARTFRPRLWSDVARDVLRALVELNSATAPKLPPSPEPALLRIGDELSLGHSAPAEFVNQALVRSSLGAELTLAQGWSERERTQTWLEGSRGRIELRADAPPGSHANLLLNFVSVPWATDNELFLRTALGEQRLPVPPGRHFAASVEAVVGPGGSTEVDIELKGSNAPKPPETRRIRLGICAIALAAPGVPAVPPNQAVSFRTHWGPRTDWKLAAQRQRMLGEGWQAPGTNGVGLLEDRGRIELRTVAKEGAAARLVLGFACDEGSEDCLVRLSAGKAAADFGLPDAGGTLVAWIDAPVGADGLVEVRVDLLRPASVAPSVGGRVVARLTELRYGRLDSLEDRVALLEAMLLPQPSTRGGLGRTAGPPPEVDHWPNPVRRLLTWLSAAES